MLVKKGLLSFAIALPLFSTMALGNFGSLDELRNRCFDFSQDAQVKPFNIKILCSGAYSYWERGVGQYALPNGSSIFTRTSCKGGRFETDENMFALEVPPYVGTCEHYIKKEMQAPEGVGIAINLQRCEDLVPGNVEALCREQVHAYCNDQFVDGGAPIAQGGVQGELGSSSSVDQYGQEGVCMLQVVDTIDTCSMF